MFEILIQQTQHWSGILLEAQDDDIGRSFLLALTTQPLRDQGPYIGSQHDLKLPCPCGLSSLPPRRE